MLRKVMDEYALIPYKETAEEINQVITLSEIAAYIYEHAPEVNTPDELAELVSKEYNEPKENVKDKYGVDRIQTDGSVREGVEGVSR